LLLPHPETIDRPLIFDNLSQAIDAIFASDKPAVNARI
jgi:hypothetical protein